MPITAAGVAAGAAVAGGVAQIAGGFMAADAKEQAYKSQAKFTFFQRMEEMRRQQIEDANLYGEAVATSFASNIQSNRGTPNAYLRELQSQQKTQQAYARWSSFKEKELIEETGASPGLTLETIGTAASTLSSAFNTYRNMTR